MGWKMTDDEKLKEVAKDILLKLIRFYEPVIDKVIHKVVIDERISGKKYTKEEQQELLEKEMELFLKDKNETDI